LVSRIAIGFTLPNFQWLRQCMGHVVVDIVWPIEDIGASGPK
jgi:hypothetical protein